MSVDTRSSLTLLALLTASGLLTAGEGLKTLPRELLVSIRERQPERALQITRNLEEAKFALGLGMEDGLRAFNPITDEFGETHVRCHQTYRGVEVYNGTVLGHMDAVGRLKAPHATLQKGITLQPVELLSEAKVRELVTRSLPAEVRLWPMQVKPLVFPTRYQDGIKLVRNAEGQFVIDPTYSVGTARKSDPYRWAFKVSARQDTKKGLSATEFILDAQTGEILKKWDGKQHVDTPSVGKGDSQYNGMVTLNTLQLTDSTNLYTLRDTTRATMPWPDPQHYGIPEWGGIGFQTVCYDPYGPNAASSGTTPYTNATDSWGDGQAFVWDTDHPSNLLTARGQTAATDAHYAIQCTWDYYNNVLGRSGGIDGQGGSPISVMHMDNYGNAWRNASWSPSLFLMEYGDGGATGPLTCLDVAAHEMSHGVMSYTANLANPGNWESGGINEGNSDIHATMVKYYFWGANGMGKVVPDTTTHAPGNHNTRDYLWTMGPQLSSDGVTPIRWLYKPSKDGLSYDAWFDGMAFDDVHYTMGAAVRAFYFLSQGAASDSTQDAYSAYLPTGMAGIGNDKAIHIWYHAMATLVTDTEATYHDIREAMLTSAFQLYQGSGAADSAEVAAVKNAFAAVNVGPAEGAQEPVMVAFPVIPKSPFFSGKVLVVPSLVPIRLPAPTVANAQDTSVSWSLGGLSFIYPVGGNIKDGLFTAPMSNYGTVWPVKATSTADPREFAVDVVYSASLDCDNDTQTDACDMAVVALAYGNNNFPTTNFVNRSSTDDVCVEFFLEGFHNAFNH